MPAGSAPFCLFARGRVLGRFAPLGNCESSGLRVFCVARPRQCLHVTGPVLTVFLGLSFPETHTFSSMRMARFSESPAATWGMRGGTSAWPSARPASRRRTFSSGSIVSTGPAQPSPRAAHQASLACPLCGEGTWQERGPEQRAPSPVRLGGEGQRESGLTFPKPCGRIPAS